MKRIFKTSLLLAAASLLLASCRLDGYDPSLLYPNAIVTVKTAEDGTCFLQLTSDSAVKPVNLVKSPFGREVRALVNITEKGASPDSRFDRLVEVNSIDSVRTKSAVPTRGEEDAAVYGADPVEVIGYWVTGLEDGYLTLAFCAFWGDPVKKHSLDLVAGTDPEDPELYVLRHNALDDRGWPEQYRMTGTIAFDLRDEDGNWPQTLSLKYRSFDGERTLRFTSDRYAAEHPGAASLNGVNTTLPIE